MGHATIIGIDLAKRSFQVGARHESEGFAVRGVLSER